LRLILLQAELLELKASYTAPAKGVVIESRLEKGRGTVATILVQSGKLNKGDLALAGESVGRIRAMTDQAGRAVKDAGPSIPVEILGLDTPPAAGDQFLVVENEKKAT
jgi:translation initiation factor IF-2